MKTVGAKLTPTQKSRARQLRGNTTDPEGLLWWALREFRQSGAAFRRQVPIGPYVVDFLCRKAKLVVELDGEQHAKPAQKTHDETRDHWLKAQGYTVIRFWNGDVFNSLNSVLDSIEIQLRKSGILS